MNDEFGLHMRAALLWARVGQLGAVRNLVRGYDTSRLYAFRREILALAEVITDEIESREGDKHVPEGTWDDPDTNSWQVEED